MNTQRTTRPTRFRSRTFAIRSIFVFMITFIAALSSVQADMYQIDEFFVGYYPEMITSGPDGNLWFTNSSANTIGTITPAGVYTLFSVPTPSSGPFGIAAGPDGNLWFTEYSADKIGMITPAGVVTEYATGLTTGGAPWGIAAGSDGNLWFTEEAGDRIGKITTGGVITEFSITAGSRPLSIAPGPDNRLWFVENLGNRIGAITTAGAVTEYSTGITASSEPWGIVKGSDDNLWFSESAGHKLGRITVGGSVDEFPIVYANSEIGVPWGITSGPDGNLWYADQYWGVGVMTTGGSVSVYDLPFFSEPQSIVTGPDGNIWFTVPNQGKIGRLWLAPAPVANFSASATSGTLPFAVTFTDTSTQNPLSWTWNFGGGATSTLRSPSYVYTSQGTFTVSLTVANPAGSSVKNDVTITVSACANQPVWNENSGTPGNQYSTIAAAYTAANPGDTLSVQALAFTGGLTIDKSIILKGGLDCSYAAMNFPTFILGQFVVTTGDVVILSGIAIQ